MEWQRVSTYGAGTLQRVPNKRFVLVAALFVLEPQLLMPGALAGTTQDWERKT